MRSLGRLREQVAFNPCCFNCRFTVGASNSMEGGNKISSKSKPAADACWIAKRPASGVHIGGIKKEWKLRKVGFIIVLFLFR